MTPGVSARPTASPAVRRLTIALVAAVVLWAILALVRSSREDRIAGLTLAKVDTAAVDTVTLARAGDTTTLVRGAGGRWSANGFAADTARVHELLRGLSDTARWSEQVSVARASHHRLQVDSTGLHVRVVTGATTPLELIVGKRTADYLGVYVRAPANDAVYAMHGADFASAFSQPADAWRSRRIAAVNPDSVASFTLTRGAHTSTLRRSGAVWTLNGALADSTAVTSLLNVYRSLDASGFATAGQTDSARLDRPRLAVSLRAKSGHPLLTLAMDSTASGVLARADTGSVVYRFDPWRVPQLLPSDTSLRKNVKR